MTVPSDNRIIRFTAPGGLLTIFVHVPASALWHIVASPAAAERTYGHARHEFRIDRSFNISSSLSLIANPNRRHSRHALNPPCSSKERVRIPPDMRQRFFQLAEYSSGASTCSLFLQALMGGVQK